MKRTESCPLCGNYEKLSDEDIVPTWARKHVIRLGSFGARDQYPRRVKMRICIDCNSTLGRIFERQCSELMKPMLDGSTVTLGPRDQVYISCWVIKTSLLMTITGLKKDSSDRTLAVDMIRKLAIERIPPAQTLVRIFKRDINEEEVGAGHNRLTRSKAPPTAFFSISSIGYLGWEMAIGPIGPILEYQSESCGRAGFMQIWPPQEKEIRWPTTSIVSTEEIDGLREAYLKSSKPDSAVPVIRRWGGPETH